MKRKNRHLRKSALQIGLLWAAMICVALIGCAAQTGVQPSAEDKPNDELFQVATLSALMQGVYEGEFPLSQLKEEGNTGIGTFDGLDGEMVVLDGEVYQVLVDGTVAKPEGTVTTPFAAVTCFEADNQAKISNIENYAQLQSELNKLRDSSNMFYAFKVTGTFEYVKTRSVAKQEEPYRPLAEVTEDQAEFEFNNVKGTLVGFWCPEYAQGVNLPGFHLHFLTEDLNRGGHLLECTIAEGTAYADETTEFNMFLPQNQHFAEADLGSTKEQDVKKAEQ